MTHQIDFLSAQKCSCLSRCERAPIVVVKSDPSSAVVLVFPKNRRSFAWKCFVREQFLLVLAHLETPIQSNVVYFRAHMCKSTIHHLSRCHRGVSKHRDCIFRAFPSSNRHKSFFWAIDKLCEIQREQIFLTFKCSCNIQCMLVPLMPQVVSISR